MHGDAWTRQLACAVEELKADAEKLMKSMEGCHIAFCI